MGKAKASGHSLTNQEASVILGMVARGDRDHDIAAWFGVNQGRVAEVKAGSHGSISAAPAADLPPKGAPGVKGRRLRAAVRKSIDLLNAGDPNAVAEVEGILRAALEQYEKNQA